MQEERNIQRRLKARHISMIAIAGCIGTGLFMTSGSGIRSAGPGGALLAYIVIGIMVYFLMTSLGEMSTYLPTSGAFSTYASRYIDQSVGFALGWNYWFNWVITVAVDVLFASKVIYYFDFAKILPEYGWSILFFIIIFSLNALSVRVYGESEYWFAMLKVLTVIAFLIIGLLTIIGILGSDYVGFSNFTKEDAPFLGNNLTENFLTTLGVFLVAGFSFQGTELIGVTAGESENPEENIPKAVKTVFWRILIFYVLAIFVIGMLIPYDSEHLLGGDDIATSPFTLVFEKAGLAFAASFMNAVILTSVLSAGNSGMYASTRMLYAMGKDGLAHKNFSKVSKNGVPVPALIVTSLVIIVLYLANITHDQAETYLFAASGLTGFIAWLGIAASHYRFRRAYKIQGNDLNNLVYKAKWFPFGSILAVILCILVIIGQDTQLVLEGDFDLHRLIITYIGIPIFLVFYSYHKIKYKTKIIPLEKVNLSKK